MQKYGFKEGQGLGKHEQGLSTALSVEKTSKRGGKIIIGDAAEKREYCSCLYLPALNSVYCHILPFFFTLVNSSMPLFLVPFYLPAK